MDPITTRDLTKRYDDLVAVDHLSLSVRPGEILGFLGPNGAGKSTTIKMLTGLVRPTEGQAWINGRDMRTDPVEAREELGYLPEVVGLYENMTGRQFLRYTGRFFDLGASEITRRTEELLAQVRLERAGSRRIGTYSKGMRQRLALAGALFHDPRVLVLDEPLTGLDPEGTLEMRDAIRRLGEEKTIFLSSHELHAVENLCHRVVVIDEGQVLADAPLAELTRVHPPRVHVRLGPGLDHLDDARTALAAVEDVVEVEPVEGTDRAFVLELEADGDEPRVLRRLVERGVPVEAYRRQAESLEEAFIRITGVGPR